jgi:hypothetical protein
MVSNAVSDPSEAVAIASLDEVKSKAKLQIWLRSHFEAEEVEEADAEPAEIAESVPPEPAADAAADDLREFSLLMQKNDLVTSNRKLTISASSLEDLTEQVCASFDLVPTSDFVVSIAGSDTKLSSLDELGAKAKLQVWPLTHFEPGEVEDDSAAAEEAESSAAEQTAEDMMAEKLRQAEMMMEYDRKASEAVSLTNTAEMTVSVVATDDQELFEVWVQQGADSWKMEKQWSDCLALQEALAEQAKMMGVKVPKLGGFSIGMRKKAAAVAADRKKSLEAYLKAAIEQLSMTNELNVFLERGMHHGSVSEDAASAEQAAGPEPEEETPTVGATSAEAAPAAQEEELLDEAREITLLIKPNELVSSTRRMNVSVRSFSELLTTVGTDLGLGDGIAMSSDADDTMQLTSLDQFGKKEKVQVWWVSKFEGFAVEVAAVDDAAAAPAAEADDQSAAPADGWPVGDVEGTTWTIGFDAEDGYYYYNTETEESLWDMPEEVALALGGAADESREISILMQKNETLTSNRKMVITASNLDQLTEQVCATLAIEPSSGYVLSVAGASAALESMDQLGAKAKLQIWPVGHFTTF